MLTPGESTAPHIPDTEDFCADCGCKIVLHNANKVLSESGQEEEICDNCYNKI